MKPNIKHAGKYVEEMKCYACRKSNLTFVKIHSFEGDIAEVEVTCKTCGTDRTIRMNFASVKGIVLN